MRTRTVFVTLCLAILILIAQTACEDQTIVNNAKRTLFGAKNTWLDLQNQAADMKLDGRLTDAQWAQWVSVDAKYRSCHNAAVETLVIYEKTKGKPAEEALAAALGELQRIIQVGVDLVNAWKGGGA